MDMKIKNLTQKLVPEEPALVLDHSVHPEKAAEAGRKVLQGLMKNYSGPVAVRLWNGETIIGASDARCTVVFKYPWALRDLILHQDLVRLAEDYLSGAIDVEGDMEALFSLTDFLLNAGWPLKQRLAAFWNAWRLPSGHSHDTLPDVRAGRTARRNSKRSIAHHYDVKAHGITLSEEQYRYARQRIRTEGLEDQVTVELRDYRDLPDQAQYDRVVSVGMFEHIGLKNFEGYFDAIKRVLKRGGLFLNHGITNDTGWQKTPITQFINRYVFPDGELARISDVNDAMEKAGFELLDAESLRRHYALR